MLNKLLELDGFSHFLDYFVPIGCFIIGWFNYLINLKDSSEAEDMVNFDVAVLYSFMFIIWLLTKIWFR